MLFTKRSPEVIEAFRWFKNGDHPYDMVDKKFRDSKEGKIVRYFRHPDNPGNTICYQCKKTFYEHGWIDSVNSIYDGGEIVCPGDWIAYIKEIQRYYVIRNNDIMLNYSIIDD